MEKFIEKNRVRATTARRAQSRLKALDKIDRLKPPDTGQEASFALRLPAGRRGPDLVAQITDASFGYGSNLVYSGLNLMLLRGQRLALLGPNGRGKSTLIKLLAGLILPSQGQVKLGQNVDIGYFSQFQMDSLQGSRTVIEELAASAGQLTPGTLRTILGSFLFSGDDVFKKVSVLSGGEKTRLVLAKIMMGAPNLLLLDEPTNHLVIPGRQMLEDALDDYEGTMVLISHDRHFINKLCDRTGVIENGALTVYPGNFDDYQRLWLTDPAALSGQKRPAPEIWVSAPLPRRDDKINRPEKSQAKRTAPEEPLQPAGRLSRAERQSANDVRRRLKEQKKPLEKLISETEKRLAEIDGRTGEVEAILADQSVYQDGGLVRSLVQELSELGQEKTRLEQVWEKTSRELEETEACKDPGA
jgi:ATP-binding cassette subfamily F protein 3